MLQRYVKGELESEEEEDEGREDEGREKKEELVLELDEED